MNLKHRIDVLILAAAQNGRIPFIPIKCTSFINSKLLESLTIILNSDNNINDNTAIENLSPSEKCLYDLSMNALHRLASAAQDHGIGLLLDAEQSHRQPAIEHFARILSQHYNLPGRKAIIYNTYQMYLKRSLQELKRDLNHANEYGYILAIKLVRGAYMYSEKERALSLHVDSPVLESKEIVDRNYNDSISMLLQRISDNNDDNNDDNNNDNNNNNNNNNTNNTNHNNTNKTKVINAPIVMIASHNRQSITHALEEMTKLNIISSNKHVHFAQIMGMCDHITCLLGFHKYNVSKLICFGKFEELMPWLLRRFQENQVCSCMHMLVFM